MINWDKFKCRCSGISKILANSRSNPQLTEAQAIRLKELEEKDAITEKQKDELAGLLVKKSNSSKVILSDGCIDYMMEVYAWETEGMIAINKESLDLLQLRKGRSCEGQAKSLLEATEGIIYSIHKERISNDYLSGEIDIYLGESVYRATNITDIKNALDYPTYLKKIHKGLENGQNEQVAGYCDITGATEGWIANCLVDNTEEDILDMQYRIAKKMNAVTMESPEFLLEWEKWDRSMRFSHIPPEKRVHKIPVQLFSEMEKQILYDRVKVCREFLWKFDKERQKLN